MKVKLLPLLKSPHSAKHYVSLAFTSFDSVFFLTLACKHELSGIAQRKVIYYLLAASVLVIRLFRTYKILSELRS